MWFLFTNWILPDASYVRHVRFREISMRPKIIEYSNERAYWSPGSTVKMLNSGETEMQEKPTPLRLHWCRLTQDCELLDSWPRALHASSKCHMLVLELKGKRKWCSEKIPCSMSFICSAWHASFIKLFAYLQRKNAGIIKNPMCSPLISLLEDSREPVG